MIIKSRSGVRERIELGDDLPNPEQIFGLRIDVAFLPSVVIWTMSELSNSIMRCLGS